MGVSSVIRGHFGRAAVVGLCGLLAGGCNFNRIAADQTTKILSAGSPAAAGYWEYELMGEAMPASIVQIETLLHVTPYNETLLVGLTNDNDSYAWGWLQVEWELADRDGDFDKADRIERRVRRIYERATALAMRAVHAHDDEGRLGALMKAGDVAATQAYMRRAFTEKEDVPALYWAGLAWGSVMANSGGDMTEIADAPMVKLLMERSVEIDPEWNHAGGLGILGGVEAAFPSVFGGDLNKAKDLFDRAMKLSKGRNHLIHAGYAKSYAVAAQDRELFLRLLNEVMDAPDQGSDIRLSNKIARVRVEIYLTRLDEWFPPAL
jgi:hypothetical protein